MISSKDNFTAVLEKDFDEDYDGWGSDFDELYAKEIEENKLNENLEASYENSTREQWQIKETKINSGAIPKNAFSYHNENNFLQKELTPSFSREYQRNDINLISQNRPSKGEFVMQKSLSLNSDLKPSPSQTIITTNKIPGKLPAEAFAFLKNSTSHTNFKNSKMGDIEEDNYFKLIDAEITPPALPTRPPPILKQTGETLNISIVLPDINDATDKNQFGSISSQDTFEKTLQSNILDTEKENKNVIVSNEDNKDLYINRKRFKQAKFSPVVEQLSKQLQQKTDLGEGSNEFTKNSITADGVLLKPAVPKKPNVAFRLPLQNDSNFKNFVSQKSQEKPLVVCNRISETKKSLLMQPQVPITCSIIDRDVSQPPAVPIRSPELEILKSMRSDLPIGCSEIQKLQSNPPNIPIRGPEINRLHLKLPDIPVRCSEIKLLESKPPDVPKRSPEIERLQQKFRDIHRACSEIEKAQSKPHDIPIWSSEIQRSQSQPPELPKRNDSYLEDLKGIDFSKCNFTDNSSNFDTSKDKEETTSLKLSQSSYSLNSDVKTSRDSSSSLQVVAETDKGYLIPWQFTDFVAVQDAINRPSLPQKLNNTQRSVSYNSLVQSFREFSVALWNPPEKEKRNSFDQGSKVTKNTKSKYQTRVSSPANINVDHMKGSSPKEPVIIENRNSPEFSKASENNNCIERNMWFHNISASEAQTRLLNLDEDGAFLVRPRTTPTGDNKYTLSVTHAGRMFNIHIRLKANGQYALGKERENEKSFSSISELIKFYQDIPFEIKLAGSSQSFGVKFRVTPAR